MEVGQRQTVFMIRRNLEQNHMENWAYVPGAGWQQAAVGDE